MKARETTIKFERVLVTGAAGFIGFHLAVRLLRDGHLVTGLDNLNAYYDINLKRDRLSRLKAYQNFEFIKIIKIFQIENVLSNPLHHVVYIPDLPYRQIHNQSQHQLYQS